MSDWTRVLYCQRIPHTRAHTKLTKAAVMASPRLENAPLRAAFGGNYLSEVVRSSGAGSDEADKSRRGGVSSSVIHRLLTQAAGGILSSSGTHAAGDGVMRWPETTPPPPFANSSGFCSFERPSPPRRARALAMWTV